MSNEYMVEQQIEASLYHAKRKKELDEGVWSMKDGTKINIKDMTDAHLKNSIAMLENKKGKGEWTEMWINRLKNELNERLSKRPNLYWSKVKPNAIVPTKRDEDAGYDIYACFDEDYVKISKHETKMIPTGIASAISNDYYFQIEERGSTGSKGIKKSAGVIDSGYRGEWFIAITNTNDKDLYIAKKPIDIDNIIEYPYEKAIAQAVVHKVYKCNECEIPYDELKNIKSERGTKKLGQSGK